MVLDVMIDGKQLEDLHMTVVPLNRLCEMILRCRWFEESCVRLENGILIWPDAIDIEKGILVLSDDVPLSEDLAGIEEIGKEGLTPLRFEVI
jgi:hypothetical protein